MEQVQMITGYSLRQLAEKCGGHQRSYSDWKADRYLIPASVLNNLCELSGLPQPAGEELKEYWYASKGVRAGARACYKKYGGIPGWTPEASQRGGRKAVETHRRRGTGYFVYKEINIPSRNNKKLAELVGILLGDGGITGGQVMVSLNRWDDEKYIPYIQHLFDELFAVEAPLCKHSTDNGVDIIISSKELVEFLQQIGLKKGSKVEQQVGVPGWIEQSDDFIENCLRGLFDTDGCIYLDKHYYGKRCYLNPGMAFVNKSKPLLVFFKDHLVARGYHPTQKTERTIFLRREQEIRYYFDTIGTSNPKHLERYKQFVEQRQL